MRYRDYLFIVTHLGAPAGPLLRTMNANPDISVSSQQFVYTHPTDLHTLSRICDTGKNARISTDLVVQNHSLRTSLFDNICKFLYFLDDPSRTVARMVRDHRLSPDRVLGNYSFRLQRMALMARNTTQSFLLTWDTLDDQHAAELSRFLCLKTPLAFSVEGEDLDIEPSTSGIAEQAKAIYNRYKLKIANAIQESQSDVRDSEENACPLPDSEKKPRCGSQGDPVNSDRADGTVSTQQVSEGAAVN